MLRSTMNSIDSLIRKEAMLSLGQLVRGKIYINFADTDANFHNEERAGTYLGLDVRQLDGIDLGDIIYVDQFGDTIWSNTGA